MNTHKPTSIKLMYWITMVIFWLSAVASIVGFGISIALIFNWFGDLQLHVGMPISANITETGTLITPLASEPVTVQLKEMYGKVLFVDTPASIGKFYAIFLVTAIFFFLYLMLTIKRLISNVYQGHYFDLRNINQLKRISYTLVIFWIFDLLYSVVQYFLIAKNIEISNVEYSLNFSGSSGSLLLFALGLWVLSHIFEKGMEFREENQLTV